MWWSHSLTETKQCRKLASFGIRFVNHRLRTCRSNNEKPRSSQQQVYIDKKAFDSCLNLLVSELEHVSMNALDT
jgi:hypothetical protein